MTSQHGKRNKRASAGGTATWTCPRCGRRLVTPNMWHSCAVHEVDEHLAGERARWRLLFARLVEAAGGAAIEVVAQKTRICFMTATRFASLRVLKSGIALTFHLPVQLDSPRIRKVTDYGNGWVGHEMLLNAEAQVDAELAGWLADSRRLMGDRERLE